MNMNYALSKTDKNKLNPKFSTVVRRLRPFLAGEKRDVIIGLGAILISSGAALLTPIIISHTVDKYIRVGNYSGVFFYSVILLVIYIFFLFSSYTQIKTMGAVGRRVLFNLRNALFNKLQELPVAFFNQNKAGDLISRINSDTDQLNQFFAQALMQFLSNFFLIVGAGIFLLVLNIRLGLAALLPAAAALIFTQVVSPWIKKKNLKNLRALGGMSAEIQESLNNFKAVVAFNRLDYFRDKFNSANQNNYLAAVGAGIANNIFTPVYGLVSNFAQIIVLGYGTYLITANELSIGLLIGFILYVNNFYMPLRQLASVWSSLQQALAGLDRIYEVLSLQSDMEIIPAEKDLKAASLVEFRDVNFGYPDGKVVLHNINFALEKGKTYALVGPTGGGKTTTASLMARLYDPTSGKIFLEGRDLRSFDPKERAKKIGFILQEPFLFTGTVRENIIYGNEQYQKYSDEELQGVIEKAGLSGLLARFENNLQTKVAASGDSISLGQKQLIAFMRVALRSPELVILDEATANIDTVTEQLLEEILKKLPPTTTKVIIAHRLNTISSADAIFFVNSGEITMAGSMEHAVEMLLKDKRAS
ncbi:MAG: ABC transporter ATP-binding protein [Patescibacteria group bacterium]|jgi:ATP-binding cassette subfamily B protein